MTLAPQYRSPALLVTLLATLFAVCFYTGAAFAAESPKPARCSFLYINGDLVVSCPRGTL